MIRTAWNMTRGYHDHLRIIRQPADPGDLHLWRVSHLKPGDNGDEVDSHGWPDDFGCPHFISVQIRFWIRSIPQKSQQLQWSGQIGPTKSCLVMDNPPNFQLLSHWGQNLSLAKRSTSSGSCQPGSGSAGPILPKQPWKSEKKEQFKPSTSSDLVGGFNPSEKWWSSSVGMMTFPIYIYIYGKQCSKPPARLLNNH